MRNRDHVWCCGTGQELRLADMKDGHLVNLLCWLERQAETLAKIGVVPPKGYMQGADVYTWMDRVRREIERRSRKEIKLAKEILGQE